MSDWLFGDNPYVPRPFIPIDGVITISFDEPNDEAAAERLWRETRPLTPVAPPAKRYDTALRVTWVLLAVSWVAVLLQVFA